MKKSELKRILRACKSGDPRAQEVLYRHYYGKMLSISLRYAYNREEGVDILHEGFVKIFQNLDQFRSSGSFEAWMSRVMVNTAINHYHRNKKYEQNRQFLEDDLKAEENFGQAEHVFSHLNYEELLQLIRQLSPAYQMVFNLYAIEGYNHREIAEILNISEGASKSNLAKARKKLQQWMEERNSSKIDH